MDIQGIIQSYVTEAQDVKQSYNALVIEYRDMVIDDLKDRLDGEYTDEAIMVMVDALVLFNFK